jgi:preprotein translocase subunit SecF
MKYSFFVKYRRVWFTFSGICIFLSLASLLLFGIRPGIDFTGGSLIELEFQTMPEMSSLRSSLESMGYKDSLVQNTGTNSVLIRLSSLNEQDHQKLLTSLKQSSGELTELKFDSIGPVIGKELRNKSILAIILILIFIGIYIFWAFRKVSQPVPSWKYSVLTIISAFHDLIIPVGVFSLVGHWLGWEIGTTFVAALLTILGYSINDTIVVFDRTRENLLRNTDEPFDEIVEKSIQQTLLRSFYTTFTTLLSLFAIYFFGGETTRLFALALIIGIASGAYSSFLASTMLVSWQKWHDRKIS